MKHCGFLRDFSHPFFTFTFTPASTPAFPQKKSTVTSCNINLTYIMNKNDDWRYTLAYTCLASCPTSRVIYILKLWMIGGCFCVKTIIKFYAKSFRQASIGWLSCGLGFPNFQGALGSFCGREFETTFQCRKLFIKRIRSHYSVLVCVI